jgi:hypothetical protein
MCSTIVRLTRLRNVTRRSARNYNCLAVDSIRADEVPAQDGMRSFAPDNWTSDAAR